MVYPRGLWLRGILIMLISTTHQLDGFGIREYLGVISTETILAASVFRDWFAGIVNFLGGRGRGYEKELRRARTAALEKMADIAREIGANGIVGIRFDYEFIQIPPRGGMLMVCVSGTAVRLEVEHKDNNQPVRFGQIPS